MTNRSIITFFLFNSSLVNWNNFSLQSSAKELVLRQLFKYFERKSANVWNSLNSLVGMSSDFETLAVFNFLIIEATLFVLTF